ncbi:Carbonyl reductase family member 4 [Diaporthe amygdali]|uniref:Carbonyl reductase family member 4 n=1 Tax=Phomopsis amygdali TaxID=1214568 RepID=UPI0022FE2BC8|nr:Carbonyl reductase family member 4 [Diaporthe amygdali]KAJ0121891.1 Carbonyl reductase family member 4 [Diaporthe amygdali]
MPASSPLSLGLGLEGTHVLVTGGAGIIGSAVVHAFLSAGANVSSIDISHGPDESATPSPYNIGQKDGHYVKISADISNAASLTTAWDKAKTLFGTVEVCVALASLDLSVLPQTDSIVDASPADWSRVLDINVGGTMLTAQLWLRGVRDHQTQRSGVELRNPSLILVGSEAGHFGVRTCAAYAAAKSAVQYGLLQSLRADAPRIHSRARVNAVAPGPVDTDRFRGETKGPGTNEWWTECQATTALARPVPTEAVARSILFLASETWSGSVHGKCIDVDSGKMGALMWNSPNGQAEAFNRSS